MGNITSLERMGHTNTSASLFGVMDDLAYRYDNGNKLLAVTDTGSITTGFKDGNTVGDDYSYDSNSNMTIDKNKGITDIDYNHLNMPTKITVNGNGQNGTIDMVYTADGTKLQKRTAQGGNTTTTDYNGNYVYENGSLKQITQPEGYIEPDGGSWQYVYRYTDIWGNTRLTYADDNNDGTIDPSNEIRREQNYYPGGLEHRGYNSMLSGVKNNLKTYQGQEFNEDLGIDFHEWRYRASYPDIMRFWQVDPLAEDYMYNSTFAFQENKLGLGTELEGLELDRQRGGMRDVMGGASRAFKESTNVRREMDLQGANGSEAASRAKQERQSEMSAAMGQSAEGMEEFGKGAAHSIGDGLDQGGDVVEKTAIGLAVFTEGASLVAVPIAEGAQTIGKSIKAAVKISDGDFKGAAQDIGEIFIMKAIGKLIGKAIDNTVKNGADTKYPVTDKDINMMETTLGTTGELMEEAGNRALEKSLEDENKQ